MDPQALATLVAAKVAADAGFEVAKIGFLGVIAGGIMGALTSWLVHVLKSAPLRKLDEQRSALLKAMLDDDRFPNHWRKLSTLSRVIGASESDTTRLLIGLGARGSENDDGLWGLLTYHPLTNIEEQ